MQLAIQTDELKALIAYMQKLGMNRGKWRDVFEPQLLEASQFTVPRSEVAFLVWVVWLAISR